MNIKPPHRDSCQDAIDFLRKQNDANAGNFCGVRPWYIFMGWLSVKIIFLLPLFWICWQAFANTYFPNFVSWSYIHSYQIGTAVVGFICWRVLNAIFHITWISIIWLGIVINAIL